MPKTRRIYFWALDWYLRVLVRLGIRIQQGGSEKAAVVILSYKRENNIDRILTSVLLCGFVDRVIVSNNNPDIDVTRHISHRDPRLTIIQSQEHKVASSRYDVARSCDSEYFICIDDDVFPDPWQLREMFACLVRNPASPVGSTGEVFDHFHKKFRQVRPHTLFAGDRSRTVDVILHIYVFTKRHLERYFENVSAMGQTNEAIHSSEDVIISFCGDQASTFLDVGDMPTCSCWNNPEIATYHRSGFWQFRLELFQKLVFLGKHKNPYGNQSPGPES